MSSSAETTDLRNIILNFRVSELQVLLGFAGRNKSGKKQELQQRALELLRVRSTPIIVKIKELHRRSVGRYEIDMSNRPSMGAIPNLGCGSSLDSTGSLGSNNSLGSIPHSRICAVPPMKRDDPPASATGLNYLQRQVNNFTAAAAALGAAGMYSFSMTPQVASTLAASSTQLLNQYPIHPDVRFKELPFYELLGEILKPTSLQQNIPQPPQHPNNQQNQRCKEAEFAFHMTPHQVHLLLMSKDYKPGETAVQLQLRFCAFDASIPQDDAFPPGLIVKVNGRVLTLPNAIPTNKPGVEPKRPPKPLNITPLCHTNTNLPNKLHVTWNHEYGKAFVCVVNLVHRHNSTALLEKLKKKGRLAADSTKTMIKSKLCSDVDDDICLTSIRVSLVCPLGQCRIQVPCRPSGCSHINCFDASFYLMMNEKKPTWICAVCDRNISFDDLYIDSYMEEVCRNAPSDCREVEFKEDGTWIPVIEEKDESKKRKRQSSDSDDSEVEREMRKKRETEKEVMIDLTETTDEEDDVPATVTPRTTTSQSAAPVVRQTSSNGSSSQSNCSRVQTSYGGGSVTSISQQLNTVVQPGTSQNNTSSVVNSATTLPTSSRSIAQSLAAARSWSATSYPAVAAAVGSSSNRYYNASAGAAAAAAAYSTEYFASQMAAAAAASAPTSVTQGLYGTNVPYPNYEMYQLLHVDDRNMTSRQQQGNSSSSRDVINLD